MEGLALLYKNVHIMRGKRLANARVGTFLHPAQPTGNKNLVNHFSLEMSPPVDLRLEKSKVLNDSLYNFFFFYCSAILLY